MPRRFRSVALALVVAAAVGGLVRAQPARPSAAPAVSFANEIAPILETRCLSCHGDAMQMGKLDLRTREAALRGGTRGADLVPGDADASRLYRRIAGLETPAMPAQGGPLTTAQVAAIRQWLDEGAAWDGPTLTSTTAPAGALAAL